MSVARILIVEPDGPFALSLASFLREDGHLTEVAGSAGEAELALAARPPALLLVRAELPDLSGFSLCARLRHGAATVGLPLILYSGETAPASLAEHARTPYAASAYLALPLDTGALRGLVRRLLEEAEPGELDEADLEEVAAPAAPPRSAGPPSLPRRVRRDALTEADRLFAARAFQSVGERREELAAEAERLRPPPRRELLATPEGRVALLREELRWREAQLARLAELWEVREREVAGSDERVHAAAVEAQRARLEAEERQGQVVELRARLEVREAAHGASVDGLLLEKAREEKDLIEVVASTEKRLHEQAALHRAALAREAALARQLGEATERVAGLEEEVAARDALLRQARREQERRSAEHSQERQAAMVQESALQAGLDRARSDTEELSAMLARATGERDQALVRAAALVAELAAATVAGAAPVVAAEPLERADPVAGAGPVAGAEASVTEPAEAAVPAPAEPAEPAEPRAS
ncbi:MAG: hypothetical protein IPO09_09515 [Anaeromyxobacter sp.]|nr:hypothetical protein [Anaeromyxobacter sp.]MBL0278649.1 hypothetical protein [Anaeromyxobacter sp.]